MADIEKKVKQGLDRCKHGDGQYCFVCPYAKENKKPFPPTCNKELCNDALSVIEQMEQRIKQFTQEQEPLEPVVFGNGKTFEEADTWWYGCPVCKKPVDMTDNFCRKCGRALMWQKDGENDG